MDTARKRSDRVAVSYYIPREVKRIIDEECGVKSRVHGEFISRLVFEHRARLEERARMAQEQAASAG